MCDFQSMVFQNSLEKDNIMISSVADKPIYVGKQKKMSISAHIPIHMISQKLILTSRTEIQQRPASAGHYPLIHSYACHTVIVCHRGNTIMESTIPIASINALALATNAAASVADKSWLPISNVQEV